MVGANIKVRPLKNLELGLNAYNLFDKLTPLGPAGTDFNAGNGRFNFSPALTDSRAGSGGDSMASLILGYANTIQHDYTQNWPGQRGSEIGTYFADDWRVNKKLGIAGALYDLGVYAVQAQLYSSRELPVRVTARHWTERTEIFNEVPEHWEWELEFEGGRKAKGFASYGKSANYIRVGTAKGRIEIRQYEAQPWVEPPADEILLVRSFGGDVERIWVARQPGGHFGGDDRRRRHLEDHQRRHDVQADLREPALRCDGRHRHRAVGHEHRVCRHR